MGRRALVVGLGTFGGGVGAARWLAERGYEVIVTDLKDGVALAASVEALSGLPIEFHLGGHDEADLDWAELIVASPAVPPGAPYLQAARARGLPVTSEIRLFVERCPAPITAITGSNGKSTTTELVGKMLTIGLPDRRVLVGGNLGRSLLSELGAITADDRVVLELSSFQLEDLAADSFAPAAGLITNLTPNHLDRHGTFDAYAAAKLGMFARQRAPQTAVLPVGDEAIGSRVQPGGRVAWFGEALPPGADGVALDGDWIVACAGGERSRLAPVAALSLPGHHNLINALGAAAVVRATEPTLPASAIEEALRRVQPLPHRLQPVAARGEVRCIDDSVATTPESTLAALGSFGDRPVYLLLGGADKGGPLDELARKARRRATLIVTTGPLGRRIEPLLADADGPAELKPVEGVRAGAIALLEAAWEAGQGVVLLSPAAASYDEFKNYTERGRVFAELCQRWLAEQSG